MSGVKARAQLTGGKVATDAVINPFKTEDTLADEQLLQGPVIISNFISKYL